MDSTFERFHWRRPLLVLLVLTLVLVPLASAGLAGQAQEASIIGQVADESGAVLPGVTVTATSPALQVLQVTDVTNERGEYRLTPLPIGTYTVEYQLTGFQSVRRQDIRVTAGFTARVDVSLKVGTLAETVTVSGAAPVVDVASTAARTQLTRETLEIIPTGRTGIQSVMVQAPGVRTNLDFGNTTSNPDFRAFGRSNDAWVTIDGVGTISPKATGNGSAQHFDYGSLEESTVQTVGNNAESVTQGIQLNIILKSGGNDFHGGGFWSQTGPRLQSDNLDDALRAQGITNGNPVETRWDLSGELGGRILRNKLWFYYTGRGRRDNVFVAQAFKTDGSPAVNEVLQAYTTEKVSYQMSPSHKLLGFHQRSYRSNYENISQFADWDSRGITIWPVDTQKLEWQIAKGNRFVSLLYGIWRHHLTRTGFSNEVGTSDQLTLRVTGLSVTSPTFTFEHRNHAKGTLSWYKPDLLWGNHDAKAGFDYSDASSDRATFDRGAAQNYLLIFRNGVPFQIDARSNPVYPMDHARYLGIYAQDSWTIARRMTLNLGVRYAHDRGFLPVQCRQAMRAPLDILYPTQCFPRIEFKTFDTVVPRLHASYDVTGDGRTVIKGGWGRFAHIRYSDEINTANGNVWLTTLLRWHDDNGNRRFDLGEVNFDRNGPDFLSASPAFQSKSLAYAVPNPNEKDPMIDEFSLSVERQLIPNFAVRGTGVYTRTWNNYRVQNNKRPYDVYTIPITNPDPGPDGRRGTADDPGTFITYYDYPADYVGQAFQQPMFVNDPTANESYKSFELAANKRLANRWALNVSYSATKLHIPYFSTSGLPTLDPNQEINAVNNTWEWLSRVSGAYIFPADVQVSANFEHRSGNPWARTVSFTGGRQIPSITLRVEPVGARRLPNLNILHLRAEKAFRFGQGQRVALRVNLYNALNINSVITLTELSGASFLRPRSIAPPRIAEFGITYSF